jgi:hypothetical protein
MLYFRGTVKKYQANVPWRKLVWMHEHGIHLRSGCLFGVVHVHGWFGAAADTRKEDRLRHRRRGKFRHIIVQEGLGRT